MSWALLPELQFDVLLHRCVLRRWLGAVSHAARLFRWWIMKLTKAQEQKAQDLASQIKGNVSSLQMGGYYESFMTSQRSTWDQVAKAGTRIATRVNEILKAETKKIQVLKV
jgi:hypothetical protein